MGERPTSTARTRVILSQMDEALSVSGPLGSLSHAQVARQIFNSSLVVVLCGLWIFFIHY